MKFIVPILSLLIITNISVLAQTPKNNLDTAIRQAKLKDAAYENVARTLQADEAGLEITEDDISEFTIDTSFGDLTGDNAEEAAVLVDYNLGGTGAGGRRRILVFTLKENELQFLGTINGGDRALGGLRNARIKGNRLEVESFTPNADECAVCYGGVQMNQYEYIATKFVKVKYSYVGDLVEKVDRKTGYTVWVLKPKVNREPKRRK